MFRITTDNGGELYLQEWNNVVKLLTEQYRKEFNPPESEHIDWTQPEYCEVFTIGKRKFTVYKITWSDYLFK